MSRGYWEYFASPGPIPVEDGIRASTRRGRFGEHWWSRRWIEVLESFGNQARLERGRTYARKGQVISIDLEPGLVTARVQGSRHRPYTVRIEVEPLSDTQWEHAIDMLGAQAFFAAQLLGGQMPPEVEDVFEAAGASLLPTGDEVSTSCSCPDWANPCKHIAAVCYLLAEALDRDPFETFALRGRTRDQVTEALREHRVSATSEDAPLPPDDAPEPLEDALSDFWTPRENLRGVHISIEPPPVETALMKRLGPPPFSKRPDACRAALSLSYVSVTKNALALAFEENRTEEA